MAGVVDKHQVRQPAQRRAQLREVVVGPDIAVDQGKGLVPQQWQGFEDSAAGFQRLPFGRVADAQAEPATIAQMIFDLLAARRG